MTEHPNAERVRRGYAAFAGGDLDALSGLFADDVVWHVTGDAPISGDYKGQEEVFGFFGQLFELSGGTLSLEIHDVLANDDHVVALVRGTGQREGKTLDQNEVHVMHMADGKVTEFWSFDEDQPAVTEFWS